MQDWRASEPGDCETAPNAKVPAPHNLRPKPGPRSSFHGTKTCRIFTAKQETFYHPRTNPIGCHRIELRTRVVVCAIARRPACGANPIPGVGLAIEVVVQFDYYRTDAEQSIRVCVRPAHTCLAFFMEGPNGNLYQRLHGLTRDIGDLKPLSIRPLIQRRVAGAWHCSCSMRFIPHRLFDPTIEFSVFVSTGLFCLMYLAR